MDTSGVFEQTFTRGKNQEKVKKMLERLKKRAEKEAVRKEKGERRKYRGFGEEREEKGERERRRREEREVGGLYSTVCHQTTPHLPAITPHTVSTHHPTPPGEEERGSCEEGRRVRGGDGADAGPPQDRCTCTPAHLHTCTPAHLHTCTYAHLHTCTPAPRGVCGARVSAGGAAGGEEQGQVHLPPPSNLTPHTSPHREQEAASSSTLAEFEESAGLLPAASLSTQLDDLFDL